MRIVNIRLTRTDKEELNMEKIIFQSDDGTAAEFYVEEQTNIAGVTYLLVSDSQDEEADAYILKDFQLREAQKPVMRWSRMMTNFRLYMQFFSRCWMT